MTKFSISKLESARQNPTQFAKSLKTKDGGWSGGKSKFSAWKYAVNEYHKTKNLGEAINYFERIYIRWFADNMKNEREREAWVQTLETYVIEHSKRGLIYVNHRIRIEIPLTPKLKITGEIPLINMNGNFGYSAYFFTKDSSTWKTELKFPIIQDYLANFYGVDLSEVEVGVFGIDSEKLSQVTFSDQDVGGAKKELNTIGQTITRII